MFNFHRGLRLSARYGARLPVMIPRHRSHQAESKSWAGVLNEYAKSETPFSPRAAICTLSHFAREYQLHANDKQIRRIMINSPSFIRILSDSIRDISLFTTEDLVALLHITTIQVDWRDSTLLKTLEPVIIERLPRMTTGNVVDCLESFAALKCGSRPFWESVISAVASMDLERPDVMRIMKVIGDTRSKFYKPIYVLQQLMPSVHAVIMTGAMNTIEIRDVLTVYSRWNKGMTDYDFGTFADSLLSLIRFDDACFDLDVFSDILAVIGDKRLRSPRASEFVSSFQDSVLATPIETAASPMAVYHAITGLYRYASLSDSPYNPPASVFTHLESMVIPHLWKLKAGRLPLLVQVYSCAFGLINPCRVNPVNFGPIYSRDVDLIDSVSSVLLRKMPELSIRELSRLMHSLAVSRRGSPELWASMVTVLGQHLGDQANELSPEEISGLLFAICEMNLELNDEMANSLILVSFEKIHQFKNFNSILAFAAQCLPLDEGRHVAGRLLELMDVDSVLESSDPAIVYSNMALRLLVPEAVDDHVSHIIQETNTDLAMYFQACGEIIHPDIRADIAAHLPGDVIPNHTVGDDVMVDFAVPSQKLAVLVSSPVLTIPARDHGRPSGTAILRHRVVQHALPGWTVANVCASDWVACTDGAEKRAVMNGLLMDAAVTPDVREVQPTNVEQEPTEFIDPQVAEDDADLSRFLRKDRHAAHRRKAPPSDSLPWVPSVLTLKTKPRRRARRSTSY